MIKNTISAALALLSSALLAACGDHECTASNSCKANGPFTDGGEITRNIQVWTDGRNFDSILGTLPATKMIEWGIAPPSAVAGTRVLTPWATDFVVQIERDSVTVVMPAAGTERCKDVPDAFAHTGLTAICEGADVLIKAPLTPYRR